MLILLQYFFRLCWRRGRDTLSCWTEHVPWSETMPHITVKYVQFRFCEIFKIWQTWIIWSALWCFERMLGWCPSLLPWNSKPLWKLAPNTQVVGVDGFYCFREWLYNPMFYCFRVWLYNPMFYWFRIWLYNPMFYCFRVWLYNPMFYWFRIWLYNPMFYWFRIWLYNPMFYCFRVWLYNLIFYCFRPTSSSHPGCRSGRIWVGTHKFYCFRVCLYYPMFYCFRPTSSSHTGCRSGQIWVGTHILLFQGMVI